MLEPLRPAPLALMPRPSLLALAGALLNRLPVWCSRFAPRPVLEAAYRQRHRQWLEGL